jgi:SAM-dependent methyltransferase
LFNFPEYLANYCVVETGVNWCKSKISTQFPNFYFTYADLFNDLYTSEGKNAADYRFPYSSNYFDLACSISVFTHILPKETDNYFKETHKILKDGGLLIATFFLLDDETKKMMQAHNGFKFPHEFEHHALMDKSVTAANVAYQRGYLFKMSQSYGFEVVKTIDGYWCGRNKTEDSCFQDMVIFKKIAK